MSSSIQEILDQAKKGDADSQYELGWIYATGEGMKIKPQEASKWFRCAAENNNSSAQFYLGWILETGFGARKNFKEAAKWYKKASEHDYSKVPENKYRSELYSINIHKAQYHLGLMHDNGKGVLKDHKKALELYNKALNLLDNIEPWDWYIKNEGYEEADLHEDATEWHLEFDPEEQSFPEDHVFETLALTFYNLGMKYYRGEGATQNLEKALSFFWEGYWMGNAHSAYMLHVLDPEHGIIDNEPIFITDLTLLSISAGSSLFFEDIQYWKKNDRKNNLSNIQSYKKAVRKGLAKSQYLLGTIYCEKVIMGSLIEEISEATRMSLSKYWIIKAYENSDKGIREKAINFWNTHELWKYDDFVDASNEPSTYEKIQYIIKVDDRYEETSLTGVAGNGAFISIGRRLINADGILKDPIKSIKYYKQAVETNDVTKNQRNLIKAKAMFELGVIYYEENTVKDYTESKYWINKAYESSDAITSKKAKVFWNKHKLWDY